MTENQVLLSLAGYNQIKAENQKFRMFMERMWENSSLSADKATVEFDPTVLTEIMHLVYPEQYKKRLSYLRAQDTKEAMKRARELEETQPAWPVSEGEK